MMFVKIMKLISAFLISLLFLAINVFLSSDCSRLEKRELICLLWFTCNRVVSVRRGFLFLCVLRMGCIILVWHSLSLPYDYYARIKLNVHIPRTARHFENVASKWG